MEGSQQRAPHVDNPDDDFEAERRRQLDALTASMRKQDEPAALALVCDMLGGTLIGGCEGSIGAAADSDGGHAA